jgi:hypothetical protein
MDCMTARMLLDFARPQAGDLEPADAAALEQHLAGCSTCQAHAAAVRQFDHQVGAALRSVDPPADLKERLLQRLEADRRRRWRPIRRWSAAAAAAAVLLGSLWYFLDFRSVVDPAQVCQNWLEGRPTRLAVEASFRRLGAPIAAHDLPDFNYDLLTAYGLAELPGSGGQSVPQLVFQDLSAPGGTRLHAIVWAIDTRRFNIAGLDGPFESPTGSSYRMEVVHQPGDRFAYLVLHNGLNRDWLKPRETTAT